MISIKKLNINVKNHFITNIKVYIYIFATIVISFTLICLFKYNPQYLTFEYWGDSQSLNRSETIRNIGLVFIGIMAIIIAIWRAIVASVELKNTKVKINQEKLHKAVELLESKSERNKISALVMLSELIKKEKVFDEIIFQILRSYLEEYSNVKKEFNKYKNFEIEEKINKWYNREKVDFSIFLSFDNYVKLIDENRRVFNLNQALSFYNLNLHGLNIKMPNGLFQNCDFSHSTIYCNERTSFQKCDLTNAIVIPYNKNTQIFHHSNISHLRLQVENDVEPLLNGWHWEGCPPKLCDMWTFLSFPKDRRVVVMSPDRIFSNQIKNDFYKEDYKTDCPMPYKFGLFDDTLEHDTTKQQIINELEYDTSNKIEEPISNPHAGY